MTPYYTSGDGRCVIYCGDCVDVMRSLPSESVQCVVTSPPYDNLRTYHSYTWDFEATARELYRLSCLGGVVCWNVADAVVNGSETLSSFKQALYFKEQVGFRVHDTMIYERGNFANPERVRYHQLFEYIFVLTNGSPRCFHPIKDKPNKWTQPFGKNTRRLKDGTMEQLPLHRYADFGMRGNVWRCKTAGQENVCQPIEHPATMPMALARDLVLSWSDINDVIMDPLSGSGTTGVACIKTNRRFIGIEISEEYCAMAVKRIKPVLAQATLNLLTEAE